MALREATGAEQLFGIDLNFALLSRREEFGSCPTCSFVIASLFDLPFEAESFDLVYSEGVIHHTYSTSEAFEAIAPRVPRGGHLFVWVYGLDDHLTADPHRRKRDHVARADAAAADLTRPSSRSKRDFQGVVASSYARRRRRGGSRSGRRRGSRRAMVPENTEHTLRDWLSPRYAHRHGFNEVIEWFESTGSGSTMFSHPPPTSGSSRIRSGASD